MSCTPVTQRHLVRTSILGMASAAALLLSPLLASTTASADEAVDSVLVGTTIELIDATSSSLTPIPPDVKVAGTWTQVAPTIIEIGTATSSSLPPNQTSPIPVAGTWLPVPTTIEIGEATSSSIPTFGLSPVAVVAVSGASSGSEPTAIEIGEASSSSIPAAAPVVPAAAAAAVVPAAAAAAAAAAVVPAAAQVSAADLQVQVSGVSAIQTADPVAASPVVSVNSAQADSAAATTVSSISVAQAKQVAQPQPIAAAAPASTLGAIGWAVPLLAFGFLMFRMFHRSVRRH